MASDKITLSDRIKEISHSTGTGNFRVDGAATGFSTFGDSYSYNSSIFYAITDGTDYEVGSGQYVQDGSNNAITRFPFKSSNSNNLVSFNAGVKEVFVTYPGKHAVFTSSGVGNYNEPVDSGLAFWGSNQILDYNPNLIWNTSNNKLGIRTNDPLYAVDIGGGTADSTLRVSGIIVGDSGIQFSGVTNVTGRQVDPFLKNVVNSDTGSNAVLELSGIVNEGILLAQQTQSTVFAGPSGGCTGGCNPDYPTFRPLVMGDLPLLLMNVYSTVAAAVAALPPTLATSGAMAFGGTHMMACDGNVWRSGQFI